METKIDTKKIIHRNAFVHVDSFSEQVKKNNGVLENISKDNRALFCDDGYVVFQGHVYKYEKELEEYGCNQE